MIEPERIIIRQLVTEKATAATSEANQYYFRVAPGANRIAVKQAIEKQFGVNVRSVNIANVKPKAKSNRMRGGNPGRKPGYKKAIITVAAGESIDLV